MIDWLKYLPNGLTQYLNVDTLGCSVYAGIDAIESKLLYLTGYHYQFSRRRAYQKAKVSPSQGSSEQDVFPILAQGLVLESSFPQTPGMTLAEYLVPPTPEQELALQAEEAAFVQKWLITYDFFVPFTDIATDPLVKRVNTGQDFHFLETLDANWDYDSEPHNGIPGVIPGNTYEFVEYHQIKINSKEQLMLVFFQVTGNPTLWVLDQGQWVGFVDEPTFNNYVGGRPNVVIQLSQVEFNKIQINPNVHKS